MKVIKIGATWCNGCIIMAPRFKEIEAENPWLDTQYYDFDLNAEEIEHLQIDVEKLPTFIFLDNNGNEIERITGEIEKNVLVDKINSYKNR